MWAFLAFHGANHHGDPARIQDHPQKYRQLRQTARQHDLELVSSVDLILVVHCADRFQFTEAQELMEDLVTDQLFAALTSPLRSKVHSSLGQYYAMQHATDEEQSLILRAGQYPPPPQLST